MSEWIDWEGGECPVAEGVLVDVRYRDGVEFEGVEALVSTERVRDAYYPFWKNEGFSNDIVAYRLSQDNQETDPESPFTVTTVPVSALDEQFGGDHYKQFEIQPVEYINSNNLDFLQGNVIKYVTRHKLKGKKADIDKAIHFCKLIIELQYAEGK